MKKLTLFSIALLSAVFMVLTGIPALFALPMSASMGVAADVAALTSYAGNYKKELIATMINGMDFKNDLMIMPVGKNGETLTRLKVKDGLRRFSSETEFDTGELKYTPRAINVKLAKRELQINPKDYYKTYLAQALSGGSGASNKQIPFDQYTWDRVMKGVASEVNDKIAYFGLDLAALSVSAFATGGSGYAVNDYVTFGTPTRWYRCIATAADEQSPATHPAKWLDVTANVIVKGFGVIIAAEVSASTISPVTTGAITSSAGVATTAFRKLHRAQSPTNRRNLSVTLCSFTDFDLLLDDLEDKITKYTRDEILANQGGIYLPGTGNRNFVKPCTWMTGTRKLINSPAEVFGGQVKALNMMFLTDNEGDMGDIAVNDTLWGIEAGISFMCGFDFDNPEEIRVGDQS